MLMDAKPRHAKLRYSVQMEGELKRAWAMDMCGALGKGLELKRAWDMDVCGGPWSAWLTESVGYEHVRVVMKERDPALKGASLWPIGMAVRRLSDKGSPVP